jgi:hypothetical protein
MFTQGPVPAPVATRHRRSRTARVVDVVGSVGSMVTLAALLVLAATAGGLADGVPVGDEGTVTVRFDMRH